MFKEHKRLIATDTLIGQGTVVEGSIVTESNLRIEGEFSGEIATKGEIVIGEFGLAKADLQATTLTIAGQVIGDVTVNGRLIITPSGQLTGQAIVQTIIVQEGGSFNGQCQMMNISKPELSALAKNSEEKSDKQQEKQEKARARQVS